MDSYKPRESVSRKRPEITPIERVAFPKVDANFKFDTYYQNNLEFFAQTFDRGHASAWLNMYEHYFFDNELKTFNIQKINTTVQEFLSYYKNFRYTDWKNTMNIRKDRHARYEVLVEKLQQAINKQ